jgi:23S rRNA pseudouridine1911/1915/1917 synthase
VGPDDGRTVRDVLSRAKADADALRDGRVFVTLRRVLRDDEPVHDGDVVEIAPTRQARAEPVRVLALTGDLVAVEKPAGVPTIADHAGSSHALVALAAGVLGVAESALHPTSRLDRDVSGVVVFARSHAAAQRLVRARAQGAYERRYVAIAARAPAAGGGSWDAPIGRARDPRLRMVDGRDSVHASTRYAVCARTPGKAVLIALAPVTGRTHQIRVHASHAGAPLIGDRAYGGPARLTLPSGRVLEPRRIALHAARVVVPDEDGTPLSVSAPVPADLVDLWLLLGGDPGAWEAATSCALG